MKTILNLVLLTIMLAGNGVISQAQTVSEEHFAQFQTYVQERVAKIKSSIPKGSSDRNTGLTPYPDTIITGYNGAEEEITSFVYDEVNGEKLPVSSSFKSNTIEEYGTINLGYDGQNRLVSIIGTVFSEGEEIPLDVTYEYDDDNYLIKTVTKTNYLGLTIEITFDTEIVRDGNGVIQEITNYQGISSIFFNEYSKSESITQIAYDDNVPVSYFRYEYFPDEFEELDSTTYRYSNLVWYEYNNVLLRQMLGEGSDFDVSVGVLLETPSTVHLDRIVSGTIEELLDCEWIVLEEISLNGMSASGYDINIESFINTREVVLLDENKLLSQKDLYYDFDGGEVSVREIYTYTDFQLEESYQRFTRNEGELELEVSNLNEYSFDSDDRLVLINETSNMDEDYTTQYIYTGTSSTFEKGLKNTIVAVFPNPTVNEVRIKSPDFSLMDAEYTIFDMSGKVIINSPSPIEDSQINVSNLGSGMYILQLRNAEQVATVKFSKL